MAVYYRDVRIRFSTDAGRATKKVNKMSKSIQMADKHAHNFSSTIKRVLIGMATFKIVTSTYFLVTRFAASLLTINSLLEQTRVSLTFMGRSATYAKQRIADMKKITVETALTLVKLSSAATIMSGFGIDMNQKWMRAMADVVAITKIDTGKLALMIGKASVGMKQTINRSFGQIGISPEKLKSEYAKVHNWAKAVYNVVTAQFGGASKNIEGTFEQVVTNLEDRFSFVSARLGKTVFNLMRQNGIELSNLLDRIASSNVLDKWGIKIGAVYKFMGDGLKELVAYMQGLWHKYGNDVIVTFRDIGTFIIGLFSTSGGMSTGMAFFFRNLIMKLSKIALMLDALRLVKDTLSGDFKQLKLDVQMMGAGALALGNTVNKGVLSGIQVVLKGAKKLIKWNWRGRTGVVDFIDKMNEGLDKAKLGLKGNVEYYKAYVEEMRKQGGQSMFADLSTEMSNVFFNGGKGAEALIDKIKRLADAAMSAAQNIKDFTPAKIFSRGMASVTWTKERLKDFNRLLSFMKTLFSGIESALAGMNRQTKIWKTMMGSVIKTIQALAAKIATLSIIYAVMSALGMGLPGMGLGGFLKSQIFGIPFSEMNSSKIIPNRGLQMFPGINTPGDPGLGGFTGAPTAAPITVIVSGDVYGYDDFSDKVKTVFKGLV